MSYKANILIRFNKTVYEKTPINIHIELPKGKYIEPQSLKLVDKKSDHKIECQAVHLGNSVYKIYWIEEKAKPLEEKHYTVSFDLIDSIPKEYSSTKCRLIVSKEKASFVVDEEIFTEYVFNIEGYKPYLYPIRGPTGKSLTRLSPEDHPHHRSVWFAFGDINGYDFWAEKNDCGKIVHRKVRIARSGSVLALLKANSIWVTPQGEALLEDYRTITVYALPPEERIIDLEITIKALKKYVFFNDTKEGGVFATRVADEIDVIDGGKIVDSEGREYEKNVWGKRADWCDYYGVIDGITAGYAIFDHPDNIRHPCHWHVRDYGMFCPNISSSFPDFPGRLELAPEETLKLKYRMYIHKGDHEKAKVSQKYLEYALPIKILMRKVRE